MAKKAKRSRRRANGAVRMKTADDRALVLMHELQVHSEEIIVQNEQLLNAQVELEVARDRYADLYDLAPIGYITLNGLGAITEINIAGAEMLGRDRVSIVEHSIFEVTAGGDRESIRKFIAAGLASDGSMLPSIDVRSRRGKSLIRFKARSVVAPSRPGQLLVAMLDLSDEDRLGAERAEALEQARDRAEQLAREISERERTEQRVKRLLHRLVTVQEEERRRLARNLHDHLGQQLTALRFNITAMKEDRPQSAGAMRERVETLDRMVARLDRDVDGLAWDLRPPALDDAGLAPAIEELLRQWSTTTGVSAEFHASPMLSTRLPVDVESHVYRIVQEALNNVGKHARASTVSVVIDARKDQLVLTVEDDGQGFEFDPSAATARGAQGGMGLIGMQERAALIGGNVAFESSHDSGTTVLVRIPLTL